MIPNIISNMAPNTHTHTHTPWRQRAPAGRPVVCRERSTSGKQTSGGGNRGRHPPVQRPLLAPPSHLHLGRVFLTLPAWWWQRLGAGGWWPVGGLIAIGWRGICCLLSTNCCRNMIKWSLLANMWSRHGCLPVCPTDCLTPPRNFLYAFA